MLQTLTAYDLVFLQLSKCLNLSPYSRYISKFDVKNTNILTLNMLKPINDSHVTKRYNFCLQTFLADCRGSRDT